MFEGSIGKISGQEAHARVTQVIRLCFLRACWRVCKMVLKPSYNYDTRQFPPARRGCASRRWGSNRLFSFPTYNENTVANQLQVIPNPSYSFVTRVAVKGRNDVGNIRHKIVGDSVSFDLHGTWEFPSELVLWNVTNHDFGYKNSRGKPAL